MPENMPSKRRAETSWAGLEDLFDHLPVGRAAKVELYSLMSGPERFYHNTGHLAVLWQRHLSHARAAGHDSAQSNRLIACAIAFHDCVYDSARQDNEIRSADVWMRASADTDLDDDERTWVAETIRATDDHMGYPARAEAATTALPRLATLRQWMLDLDLTPLGEPPEAFDRNTQLLRIESRHLSSAQWETNRLRMLRYFAASPMIYRTPTLAGVFERPARYNIERELAAAATVSRCGPRGQ